MKATFVNNASDIGLATWNRIAGTQTPFLRYEFHAALESHHCVGAETGWLPQHLVVRDDKSDVVAFMPLYVKFNSYGEMVFDWAWAEAFQRAGQSYYPKLVSAIPYTPAPGKRLLIADDADQQAITTLIIQSLKAVAENHSMSSIHCLFLEELMCEAFESQEFVRRLGCQFHWHNEQYDNFDHFVSMFASRKRKNVLKERRRCFEQGITFHLRHGNQIAPDQWPTLYHFYQKTFVEKSGLASFTLPFFQEISQTMGEQFFVIEACHNGVVVAVAFFYHNRETLWGRHWGCNKKFDSLHFETCYYQGIDFAIAQNIQLFEPGAQGEHKISRGFVPTETWSTHWVGDATFRDAIYTHVKQEEAYMKEYILTVNEKLPFKKR